MNTDHEYSIGEERASAWVQYAASATDTNTQLMQAIEQELQEVRSIEPRMSSTTHKANMRGYMDGLAREYVRAQDLS